MMFFLFVAVTFGLLALLVLDIIIAAPLVVLGLAIVIFIENDIGYWSLFFMLFTYGAKNLSEFFGVFVTSRLPVC